MRIGSLFAGVGGFDLGFERAGFTTSWAVEIDEKAQAVLRLRFPKAELHDDVTQVGAHNLSPVDVITYGFPCFPAGTLILSKRGLLPIEEVVVGDEVVSHLGKWQRVLRIGSKMAPTRLVKGQGHHGLVTTDEHPFYASKVTKAWDNAKRSNYRKFSDLEWIEAKDLTGCMWSSLLTYPASEMPPMVTQGRETSVPTMTPELMCVIGAWLADGWVRDTKRPGRKNSNWGLVMICAGYGPKADRLRQRISDAGLTFCEANERTTVRFIISSGTWSRWLTENFGRYSFGKTIPAWMFGASEELRRAFLDGYLLTDGYRSDKARSVTTVSKFLAVGVSMLIRQTLRLSTTMALSQPRKDAFIEGRKINERPQYCVRAHDTARSSIEKDGYRLGLVRSSEPTGRVEEVFNIEVEGDNSYIADGIVVHNCQDLSVAGKRAGLDGSRSGLFYEAVRVIRELRERDGKPDIAIAENVPGLFSSAGGNDFEVVLKTLGDIGARDIAWRILDSRYHAVAQRRRRVFLVADFGGERAGEILSLAEGMCRNPPKKRGSREKIASDAGTGAPSGGRFFDQQRIGQYAESGIASTCAARDYKDSKDLVVTDTHPGAYSGQDAYTGRLVPMQAKDEPIAFHPTQDPIWSDDGTIHTLGCGSSGGTATGAVVERAQRTGDGTLSARTDGGGGLGTDFDLDGGLQPVGAFAVRRLTVREVAKLQAFPPEWNSEGIDKQGKRIAMADSSRYKQMGNAVTVNVVHAIAERVAKVLRGETP